MRRLGQIVAATLSLTACSTRVTPSLQGNGASSSAGSTSGSATSTGSSQTTTGSTSGSTTAGSSNTTTSGSTTSGTGTGSSTSGTTAGSTSGASSGSSTGAGAAPCTWDGGICAVDDCTGVSRNTLCHADGGLGRCFGGTCHVVDLQSDPQNCGAYGLVCPAGTPCVNGTCTGANPNDSSSNCGCPTGTICEWYSTNVEVRGCILEDCHNAPDDAFCAGSFCCRGQCLPWQPDPNNCGGCGIQCAVGDLCVNSACTPSTCTANNDGTACLQSYNGAGTCCGGYCNPIYDTGCNSTCDSDGGCPDGSACLFGAFCEPTTCGPDSDDVRCLMDPDSGILGLCCGGSCVDLSNSAANCGSCGRACAPGETCWGNCGIPPSCGSTGDSCISDAGVFGVCCEGACLSVDDSNNCSACDLGCPVNSWCQTYYCDGGCGPVCISFNGPVSCSSDADCPSGRVCGAGACVPPSCDGGNHLCRLDGDAGIGWCCGLACVDVTSDPSNCGGCGYSCPSGLECVGDACSDPDAGPFAIGPLHPCPLGWLSEFDLSCIPPSCEQGSEGRQCSLNAQQLGICCDGQCVDLSTDPANCGSCGIACASGYCDGTWGCAETTTPAGCLQSCGTGTICANHQCVSGICPPVAPSETVITNGEYCMGVDGTAALCCPSGACAHFDSDSNNCGGCGITCPSGQICQNGLCNGVSACAGGHAVSYCDIDAGLSFLCCPGVGCTDTSFDSQNCGGCNAPCSTGESCDAGICVSG